MKPVILSQPGAAPSVSEHVRLSKLSRMQNSSIKTLAVIALLMLTISAAAVAQKPGKPTKASKPSVAESPEPDPDKGLKPPSGPGFYIAPVEGSKGIFSVLLGNGNITVAGTFTQRQIDVFEAVLQSAKEFAQTDEAVGKSAPIITRLMDQHEWSLFVDVSKVGDRSKLYVTLITPGGKLTADAGEIVRGSKKEPAALLLKMLSQVQEAKAAAPPQL